MNFDKEINRIAANIGMVPGTVKTFEFDGRKVNAVDIYGGHRPENAIWIEYLTIDAVVLKEGKSGNTQLRMQGYVKYSNRENAMYRVIVPWEIDPSDLSKILETISK